MRSGAGNRASGSRHEIEYVKLVLIHILTYENQQLVSGDPPGTHMPQIGEGQTVSDGFEAWGHGLPDHKACGGGDEAEGTED